jgi:hypothetical protein
VSFTVPRTASPRALHGYARNHSISAVLLLFGILIGIRILRRRSAPTGPEVGGLLIATVIVVLGAMLLPDVVFAFLGALLIVAAADVAPQLSGILDRMTALVSSAAGKAGG